MIVQDNFAEHFENLPLTSHTFHKTEFEECTFHRCDFSHATFTRCRFDTCRFTHCDLSLIQVLDTRFSACVFEDCKLIGVDWSKADWSGLTQVAPQFLRSVMHDSSFWGLQIEGIMIEACDVRDVDFREANMSSAHCANSDFLGALFSGTKLLEADFSHATNFDIDVRLNDIKGAKFSRYEAIRLLSGLDIVLVD